ncbi:MAG: DUF262 domain-containing protein [Desulfobaccales bacterium]
MKIESTDQEIRTLLSSGYYKIPRFQRPYSWEREHIQEFWDDVIRDSPLDYFIGSMVVYKVGTQYYGVVDGQQRLTTITILLCVLRNALAELGFQDLAEGIQGLIERRNIDNKLEFILSPESSYPFFQDYIQKWGSPEVEITALKEEQNLQRAYDDLKLFVDGVINSVYSDTTISEAQINDKCKAKLIKIRDSLLGLKLIFIKLEDEDDAYLIFETLNTRGKDLSLTDLVKNHLTKLLKSKSVSVDQTKIKWERIVTTIQGSSVEMTTDTFIHHYWLSKYDYSPAKNLFKVLKKQITKIQARSFLDNLLADSVIYRSIHETTFGKWSKQEQRIKEALEALILFRVRQQTPSVLSLVREYRKGKIKKKHLEAALVSIEKFHFLFTAITSQRSSGGISSMYASLARRLFEVSNTHGAVDIIRELRDKLRTRIPSEDEVIALFPEIIFTENFTKDKNLIKYALVGLARENPKGIIPDFNALTIEHLIPQSMIGNNDYSDQIIGQMGNLILISEDLNEKLENKSFAEKKIILKAEGYNLFPDIFDIDELSSNEIIARPKRMASIAYNSVWKI